MIELAGLELAAARWLTHAAGLVLIGTAGARFVVRRAHTSPLGTARPPLEQRISRLGLLASAGWVIACLGTLAAQVYSWFGVDGFTTRDRVITLLTETHWGAGWQTMMTAAVLATAGHLAAIRLPRTALTVSVLTAFLVAWTIPLTGHSASHAPFVQVLHTAHVLGGGLWLGTLTVVALTSWTFWHSASPSIDALRALLAAFSPVAIAGAALVAASGALMTLEHVRPLSAILESSYGRLLVAKVATVSIVAALGWRNWRRLGPRVSDEGIRAALRRATAMEIVLGGVIVLALTAWLSGQPMPME